MFDFDKDVLSDISYFVNKKSTKLFEIESRNLIEYIKDGNQRILELLISCKVIDESSNGTISFNGNNELVGGFLGHLKHNIQQKILNELYLNTKNDI